MKNYFKGLLSGIILVIVMFSIIAFAQSIDTSLSEVRISINGIDKAQWGENFILDNGSSVPYSILYNDTTYLPMRKIAEFSSKAIYWNGDSKTVAMTELQTESSQKILTEKSDSNGNMWTYYLFTTIDNKLFLGVVDNIRGFERVYQIEKTYSDKTAYFLADDGIYFVRKSGRSGESWGWTYDALYKISFLNDENSQDGKLINTLEIKSDNNSLFDGKYLYWCGRTPGNGTRGRIYALDILTGEQTFIECERWQSASGLIITSSTNDETTLSYIESTTGPVLKKHVVIKKTPTIRFGIPVLDETVYPDYMQPIQP